MLTFFLGKNSDTKVLEMWVKCLIYIHKCFDYILEHVASLNVSIFNDTSFAMSLEDNCNSKKISLPVCFDMI